MSGGAWEQQRMNLPQFNGHFKKYTEENIMKKKGPGDCL